MDNAFSLVFLRRSRADNQDNREQGKQKVCWFRADQWENNAEKPTRVNELGKAVSVID